MELVTKLVAGGFQNDFRSVQVRNGLHQRRKLLLERYPKRSLGAVQLLRRRGSAAALFRRNRNQITGIDVVEDQLFGVRCARGWTQPLPAYARGNALLSSPW